MPSMHPWLLLQLRDHRLKPSRLSVIFVGAKLLLSLGEVGAGERGRRSLGLTFPPSRDLPGSLSCSDFRPITPCSRRKAILFLGGLGINRSRPMGRTNYERGLQDPSRVSSSTGRSATLFADLPSQFRKVQGT